jgi:hypothetical protein
MNVWCRLAVLAALSACAGSDEETLSDQLAVANFDIEPGTSSDPGWVNVRLWGRLAERTLDLARLAAPYPSHQQISADGFTLYRFAVPTDSLVFPMHDTLVCIVRPAGGSTECRLENEPVVPMGPSPADLPDGKSRNGFSLQGGQAALFLYSAMESIALAAIPPNNRVRAMGDHYQSTDGVFDCVHDGQRAYCDVTDVDEPAERKTAPPPDDQPSGDRAEQVRRRDRNGEFEITVSGTPAETLFTNFGQLSEVAVDGRAFRIEGYDRGQIVCIKRTQSTQCGFMNELPATMFRSTDGGQRLSFAGPAATTIYADLGGWSQSNPSIHRGAGRLAEGPISCWPQVPDATMWSPAQPPIHACDIALAASP